MSESILGGGMKANPQNDIDIQVVAGHSTDGRPLVELRIRINTEANVRVQLSPDNAERIAGDLLTAVQRVRT